jgi:hypothetical protein
MFLPRNIETWLLLEMDNKEAQNCGGNSSSLQRKTYKNVKKLTLKKGSDS